AFSPDGRRIVTANHDGTGVNRHEPHAEVRVESVAPDLAFVSGIIKQEPMDVPIINTKDYQAQVWNAETGQAISLPMRHQKGIVQAAFSPDGLRVVTGSPDGPARVWDALPGRPLTPPLPHGAEVTRAAFSPDGALVATACADGTVRLWLWDGAARPRSLNIAPKGNRVWLH